MANFTSWSAVETQMKNDFANRDVMVGSYKLPDGREVKYRDADDFEALWAFVKSQAAAESATSGRSTRSVSMKPFSGSW